MVMLSPGSPSSTHGVHARVFLHLLISTNEACGQTALSAEVQAGISSFYLVLFVLLLVVGVFAIHQSRRGFLPPKNDIELQRKKGQ